MDAAKAMGDIQKIAEEAAKLELSPEQQEKATDIVTDTIVITPKPKGRPVKK